MANWETFENVKFAGLYKRVGDSLDEYILKLRVPKEVSLFNEMYEITIRSSKLKEKLNQLKNNKVNICYFAYGMQDIDVYRTKNGYGITHSPHEGLNLQFLLAENEFDKFINDINR